jgi:leucyl/phenylalanyl-tRNA---protein transferase
MPIYRLNEELRFPPPEGASPEGIVAVGGDFRPERLLLGYAQGIFPWPSDGLPLLWFSPDPRFVLPLDAVHVPKSLKKRLRRETYSVRFDTQFSSVIRACAAAPRQGQRGTWITEELMDGYEALHRRGFAHSVEAYEGERLVGGLYGVALGRAFFGESMFAEAPDASKCAFAVLLAHLKHWGFSLVDCQVYTEHLERFGAIEMPRASFLRSLRAALSADSRLGPWTASLGAGEVLAALDDAGE